MGLGADLRQIWGDLLGQGKILVFGEARVLSVLWMYRFEQGV